MLYSEKLKMYKIILTDCLQITSKNLFAKLVQSVSSCYKLSKKLKIIEIWQLKIGQNTGLLCYRKK